MTTTYYFGLLFVRLCDPNSPGCPSLDTIWATLWQCRLNVWINNGRHTQTLYYFFQNNSHPAVNVVLRRHIIGVNADYLRSFVGTTESYLEYYTSLYNLKDTGNRSVMTIQFSLSDEQLIETRRRHTILDLIGSWGALLSALGGFMGIYFLAFNTAVFYKEHPTWDNYDPRLVDMTDLAL
eukprot:NODE_1187_length_646_cov_298.508604_g1178_i0.p1 GENE.NODE_1187_length_646_cov_298.508604_g1178_i0~~NODE_1187_length_646_cov_298.508604_g1178_i0.p1  ORF type:complete len:207 (+),score=12.48 NODE_1187_length_646_cov_298.508604_g1178_i0:84-623(+)